jgi:hypothetical protein
MTKALFGQPDSKIPGLFDTATTGHLSKQDDGSYGARLSGTLARLNPRPLGASRRGKDSASTGATGTRRRNPRGKRAADTAADEAEDGEEAP